MARVIEFEGRRIEVPDDFGDDDIASVLQQPSQDAAPEAIPTPQPRPASAPQPGPSYAHSLGLGVQNVGTGLAEIAGAPVDLTTAAMNVVPAVSNKVFGTEYPGIQKPVGGSEWIKEQASNAAGALGIPTLEPENLGERVGANVTRFGTQSAVAIPALAGAAATRGAQIAGGSAPRLADSLLRPYMGENIGRTVAGDAAAATGAGTGVTAAEESGYDSPLMKTLAAIGGGISGVTGLSAGAALARGGAKAIGRPFGANIDPSINVDPNTLQPTTKTASDRAAGVVQSNTARGPDEALRRLTENRAELEPQISVLPTPAQLAEDPGLARMETSVAVKNQGPAVARQQDFNSSVRDTIDRVAPEDATAQPLIDRANRVAGARTEQAQREVDRATGQGRGVEIARQEEGNQLAPLANESAKVDASRRLDKAIVDEGYIPARAEKNRQFDEAPGRENQVPADEILSTAASIRARNNSLRPDEQLPSDVVQRLETLKPSGETIAAAATRNADGKVYTGANHAEIVSRPDYEFNGSKDGFVTSSGRFVTREEAADIANASGQADKAATSRYGQNKLLAEDYGETGGGTASAKAGDLADLRMPLADAHKRAQQSGNFDLADSISELRKQINKTIEGAPGYEEANANYKQFADTYRPVRGGKAAEFTKTIDRNPQRGGAASPERTASKFLDSGSPTDAQDLTRMSAAGATPEATRATRDYLMSDMATKGVLDQKTGTIRPDRLRAWMNGRADLGEHPEFRAEAQAMLDRAQRGERLTGQFADELKTAQQGAKQTESQIDKGALGMVINSDPDKAVSAVMSQKDRSGRLLQELVTVTENDPQARNGLKAAVRDFLVDKATTGAGEKLKPGDNRGPVSFDKLNNILKEHEKELAQILSPEEMNTLRAGHKALALSKVERTRLSTGSDTVEKRSLLDQMRDTPLGKGLESAARLHYGSLNVGGKLAGIRRALPVKTATDQQVEAVVARAAFDPDLMGLLLGRKIPVGSPAWNSKLNTLLGTAEGARNAVDED